MSAASSRGSARCWSATTQAAAGTSMPSTRTVPRSASSRSGVSCRPTATQAEIEAAVDELNADPACTLYIVQLPLPKGIDENAIIGRIDPAKDADGLHPTNLGWLVLGKEAPLPCTPRGMVELLRRNDVPIAGQHVVVVGRGITVGRPMGLLLTRRSENATVTLCHTGTRDLGRRGAPRRHRHRGRRRAGHHHRGHGQAGCGTARRGRQPRRGRRHRRRPGAGRVGRGRLGRAESGRRRADDARHAAVERRRFLGGRPALSGVGPTR